MKKFSPCFLKNVPYRKWGYFVLLMLVFSGEFSILYLTGYRYEKIFDLPRPFQHVDKYAYTTSLSMSLPSDDGRPFNSPITVIENALPLKPYITLLTYLEPDVVILYEGINDVHPRLFNNLEFDYRNYRKIKWDSTRSLEKDKSLLRFSNSCYARASKNCSPQRHKGHEEDTKEDKHYSVFLCVRCAFVVNMRSIGSRNMSF